VGRPKFEIPQVVFYSFAAISVIQGLAEKPHLKWVVFIIAETLLILVFVRTMYHWAQVARGRALWRDPLAPASAWVDEKTGGRVGHCEGDDAAITPA
jgi:hypothetical protein